MLSSKSTHSAHPSRGGWRGHSRGGYYHRGNRSSLARGHVPSKVSTPSPEPPLGPLLSCLDRFDFDEEAMAYRSEAIITDCRPVASYNWLDEPEATIAIPGKPPRWTPPAQARKLKSDSDEYFRDRNAANFPRHPMEPAVVAALAMDAAIAPSIDLFACSSTIGNLLRFVRGADKDFRILVESVRNTVFLTRRENSPRELIPDVKGYGHTFPEAYTSWDAEVKGSTSHQRVLSYRFGGLRCLVRFEADGYIANKEHEDVHGSTSAAGASGMVDELTTALSGNRVTSVASTSSNNQVHVIRAGHIVEQESMFELKTRSVNRKQGENVEDTLGEQLPRLWVSQLAKFILAYHTYGVFKAEDTTIRDVKEEVSAWEKDHVNDLSRLAALLHRIMALVRVRADCKLELRRHAAGTLEVREQMTDVDSALSERVQVLWLNDEDEDDVQSVCCGTKADDRVKLSEKLSDDDGSGLEFGSAGDDDESELDLESSWDFDGPEPDYTACSADDCGYCGRCTY